MTTTSQYSTLIAVFTGLDQANQAIDNLRHAGFGYDQIRLVDNGTNSFFEDLKGLFTGHTTAATNSADDWMRIGVPEQDAHFYQGELDSGHSILLSKAINNPEQALSILRQSGAYDIAFRMRNAQPAMTQGTYNPNTQQGAINPNVVQELMIPMLNLLPTILTLFQGQMITILKRVPMIHSLSRIRLTSRANNKPGCSKQCIEVF